LRFLRSIANHALRDALEDLSNASEPTVERAYGWVRRIAVALGLPIPADVDAMVLRNLAQTVGGAIVATEYGAPLRFEQPLVATLAVSGYCPFACANCYANSLAALSTAAASNDTDNFVRVASTKIPFVVLTGGEPLADPRLSTGLATLLDAGKMVYLATNASIDHYLPLAERYRRRLAFLFSIWGTRQRHNERRGENSFERVERNCRSLSAKGLRANLLVVLADNDLSVFADVRELLRSWQIASVRVIRKLEVGRLEAQRFEPTPDWLHHAQLEIAGLRAFCSTVVADIPELRRRQRRSSIAQRALGIPSFETCAAGAWMIHLESSGAAYPCYVFESSGSTRIPAGLSIDEQWLAVREARRSLPTSADCVGEAAAHLEEPIV
jgi:MoaA/NifB/PqqE/SkfB family radical SAM enzyme